jgi:hypothetical protein
VVGLIRQADATTGTVQMPELTVACSGKRKFWREFNL